MIELQKLADRIEEEFGLKFEGVEYYYFIKWGSSNLFDFFTLEYVGNAAEVFVRLTPNSFDDVDLRYVLFYNDQIDEFIGRLKRVILAIK